MRKTKQGISLIVLVITIIIMIILAATIIISLNNTGIIGTAQNAVCKTNIKQAQNLAVLKWAELYTKGERDTEVIKEKIKEEFTKNKLNPDNYEISVTTGGVEVSSKVGCIDASGVEGGNGDTGSDVIPTNWNYAYTYDRTTQTWTAVATNDGTEPTGDVIVRLYKNGVSEVYNEDEEKMVTMETYDMIVSGTGEFNLNDEYLDEEDRIMVNDIPIEYAVVNLEIREGITSIGECAFGGENYWWPLSAPLKSVKLPSSLKSIGNRAFYYCVNLEEVIIPEGLESIETSAFLDCSSLKNISLPNSLKSLGEGDKNEYGAFAGCEVLETITFPATVTRIPAYTFYGCDNLKTFNYRGTQEQLVTIDVEDTGNDPLFNNGLNVVYEYKGE